MSGWPAYQLDMFFEEWIGLLTRPHGEDPVAYLDIIVGNLKFFAKTATDRIRELEAEVKVLTDPTPSFWAAIDAACEKTANDILMRGKADLWGVEKFAEIMVGNIKDGLRDSGQIRKAKPEKESDVDASGRVFLYSIRQALLVALGAVERRLGLKRRTRIPKHSLKQSAGEDDDDDGS